MGDHVRLNFISTNRDHTHLPAEVEEVPEESLGIIAQLKEAFLDLFFEESPADKPIGLTRLTTETFRQPVPAPPINNNPFLTRSIKPGGRKQIYY